MPRDDIEDPMDVCKRQDEQKLCDEKSCLVCGRRSVRLLCDNPTCFEFYKMMAQGYPDK